MSPRCYGCKYRKKLPGLNITACHYAVEANKPDEIRGCDPSVCPHKIVKKVNRQNKDQGVLRDSLFLSDIIERVCHDDKKP